MAAKQPKKPISPFYRAMFRIDKKAMGYKDADDGWGRAAGFVMARHRWKDEHTPYRIPNEYICARLGTVLGLPIPPFALTKISDGGLKLMFSTLDFNPSGIRLPPILPDVCMQRMPFLCTGIIAFDVWIANEDRHDENLAVDKLTDPKTMRVFDHDQALFGGCDEIGIPRLIKLRERLGMTGSGVTGGNPHCLIPWLTSDKYFEDWTDRYTGVGRSRGMSRDASRGSQA